MAAGPLTLKPTARPDIESALGRSGSHLAKHHIIERARGRTPDIAPEEIKARGIEGISIGTRELQATLATAAERFGFLAGEPLDERYADLVAKIQVGNRVLDDQDVETER